MKIFLILCLTLLMVFTGVTTVAALAVPSILTASGDNPETYRTANGYMGMQPRVMICDTLPIAWASGGVFVISSLLLGFAIKCGSGQREMVRAADNMEKIARELETMQRRVEARVGNLETILTTRSQDTVNR